MPTGFNVERIPTANYFYNTLNKRITLAQTNTTAARYLIFGSKLFEEVNSVFVVLTPGSLW